MCLSVQVQMQPQWQAQDPCNDDGKVRNVVALERQKNFRGDFCFFQPELGFARAPPFLKIGMAKVVSSK